MENSESFTFPFSHDRQCFVQGIIYSVFDTLGIVVFSCDEWIVCAGVVFKRKICREYFSRDGIDAPVKESVDGGLRIEFQMDGRELSEYGANDSILFVASDRRIEEEFFSGIFCNEICDDISNAACWNIMSRFDCLAYLSAERCIFFCDFSEFCTRLEEGVSKIFDDFLCLCPFSGSLYPHEDQMLHK